MAAAQITVEIGQLDIEYLPVVEQASMAESRLVDIEPVSFIARVRSLGYTVGNTRSLTSPFNRSCQKPSPSLMITSLALSIK